MLGATTTAPLASTSPSSPAIDGESQGDNAVHHHGAEKMLAGEPPTAEDVDAGEKLFGGNRWPRQETLALLKIRSDMDAAFKEATVKGPLWDEVSRKLAELGYHRSAKKCREKFENVFKYHKRTKEGRTGKSEGKTYRFFDQLEAFESQSISLSLPPPPLLPPSQPPRSNHVMAIPPSLGVTVSSSASMNFSHPAYPHGTNPTMVAPPPAHHQQFSNTHHMPPPTTNITSSSFPGGFQEFASDSSSSSTSSDMEIQGRHRKKRKWKEFFERLLREVIQKQENMQRRFLEEIEKKEQERIAREDSWRIQEIARINREREILSQERSMSAAKDAAVMSFLQKLADQHNLPVGPLSAISSPLQQTTLQVISQKQPFSFPQHPPPQPPLISTAISAEKSDNIGDQNPLAVSSSRWPKSEVQALIKLRSKLESKYQENGPKGPLWEEISSEMKVLGYNRNAKRCKEKWENINKYFKKVKESNKSRPEDSKTCPYFHQLDALYKEKNKSFDGPSSSALQFRPENSIPLLVQPEQQWPPPPPARQQEPSAIEEMESEQDREDDDEKENEEEEEEEASEFRIVANNAGNSADES